MPYQHVPSYQPLYRYQHFCVSEYCTALHARYQFLLWASFTLTPTSDKHCCPIIILKMRRIVRTKRGFFWGGGSFSRVIGTTNWQLKFFDIIWPIWYFLLYCNKTTPIHVSNSITQLIVDVFLLMNCLKHHLLLMLSKTSLLSLFRVIMGHVLYRTLRFNGYLSFVVLSDT